MNRIVARHCGAFCSNSCTGQGRACSFDHWLSRSEALIPESVLSGMDFLTTSNRHFLKFGYHTRCRNFNKDLVSVKAPHHLDSIMNYLSGPPVRSRFRLACHVGISKTAVKSS